MGKKRTRRSAQQWQSLLEKHQDSGLSAPQICQTEGIGYQSFMKWQKRLISPARPAVDRKNAFIELTPPAGTEDTEGSYIAGTLAQVPMPMCVELSLGGGIELRITPGPDVRS